MKTRWQFFGTPSMCIYLILCCWSSMSSSVSTSLTLPCPPPPPTPSRRFFSDNTLKQQQHQTDPALPSTPSHTFLALLLRQHSKTTTLGEPQKNIFLMAVPLSGGRGISRLSVDIFTGLLQYLSKNTTLLVQKSG